MRIALVISSFDVGGAERVASILCNRWARCGHDVFAIVSSPASKQVQYHLASSITYVPLDMVHDSSGPIDAVWQNVRRLRRLRAALRRVRPTIVVSFMIEQNVLAILSARSLGIPIVASERVHPGFHDIGRLRKIARALTYPHADLIVVQTTDIEAWFSAHMNVRTAVLPNPIVTETFAPPLFPRPRSVAERRVVAIGRLEPQKGFVFLIDAFSRVASDFPHWRLDIYGIGSVRVELQRRIATAGLESRVALKGVVDNIPQVLHDTDLFVHASLYEGFPNTVVEALASGCCVVATDAPGATSEILADGEFGLLVEPRDTDGLAESMAAAMRDDVLRTRYACRAPRAARRYSVGLIAGQWLDLLSDISTHRYGAVGHGT